MIRFANARLLWLLWLNIPIIYFYYRHRRPTVVFPSLARLRVNGGSMRRTLSHSLIALRVIAFSCLVIALARPQSVSRVEQIKSDVVDIVIALDVSLSMGSQDFKTGTRLEVAKDIIGQF